MIQFASTPEPVSGDEQAPTAAPAPASPVAPAAPDPDRKPSQQERLAAMDALSRLGDEIAELSAHLDAATYRILERLREFDEKGGWTGFRSCAAWLSWRTSLAPGAAREHVRVARALGDLPLLSEEMRHGRVSYSKARALTRITNRGNEAQLVELAKSATAAQIERFVRGWRQVDRAKEAEEERLRHRSRKLALYPDADGSWVVRGRLDPEVGAMLQKALEAADRIVYPKGSPQAGGPNRAIGPNGMNGSAGTAGGPPGQPSPLADRPTWDQRRADAMGLVAEAALGEGLALPNDAPSDPSPESGPGESRSGKVRRAERFQVVLHVTPQDLRATPDVSAETSAGGMAEIAANAPLPGRLLGDRDRVSAETSRGRIAQVGAGSPQSEAEDPGAGPAGAGAAAGATGAAPPCGCGGIAAGPHAFAALPDRLLGDRGRVSAETSRRIACDASVVRMTHDAQDGASPAGRANVLDVGRKSRIVPSALRRALEVRDRGCRFPGCEVGVRWCDAHHVVHWADGGETKLGNLLLACKLHHRALHEEGYRVELDPDGTARFHRPDGRLIPEVPTPPAVPEDPATSLREGHREVGIEIDGWTPTPSWLGEPFDPHWAVGVMWTPGKEGALEANAEEAQEGQDAPRKSGEPSTGSPP